MKRLLLVLAAAAMLAPAASSAGSTTSPVPDDVTLGLPRVGIVVVDATDVAPTSLPVRSQSAVRLAMKRFGGLARPRNSSASVVVDARDPGRDRWVSASGPIEILRDGEAQSINACIRRRYLAPEALNGPIEAELAASDDVTLRLAPTTWRSWTPPIVESPKAVVPSARRLESSSALGGGGRG
jgi:hypothetical protein